MISLLKLFFLQFKRGLVNPEQDKKFPLILLIVLLVFVILQLGFVGAADGNTVKWSGWAIAGIFVAYTVFGMLSNRLPWRMEDMVWLYSVPHRVSSIAIAAFVWQVAIRGGLWLVSAVIADVVHFVLNRSYMNITGKAVSLIFFIVVLEAWLMAVSCARTRKITRFVFAPGALLLFAFYATAVYSVLWKGIDSPFWQGVRIYTELLGYAVIGTAPLSIWVTAILLFLFSVWLIRNAADSLECKEKLLKEADFWAEFKDHHAFIDSIGKETRTSWWGLSRLSGTLALVWMEVLITKKNLTVHILQFIAILAIFHYLIVSRPEWLYIGAAILAAAFLMNAYYSGLVRHMQSGDIFWIPGKLWIKTLLLEISHTVWIVPLFFYCVTLAWREQLLTFGELPMVVTYGAASYILALGIRLTALTWSYDPTSGIPILRYYKCLLLCCGAGVAVIWGLTIMLPDWKSFLLPVALSVLGATAWLYSYKQHQ